jgi:hypothetical protein
MLLHRQPPAPPTALWLLLLHHQRQNSPANLGRNRLKALKAQVNPYRVEVGFSADKT